MEVKRKRFYGPEKVLNDVEAQVRSVEEEDGVIDHLTFVPDGEPTLDIDLGKEIEMVRDLGYPVAVITNSSLIWDEGVREELSAADIVSVKVDSADEMIWKRTNRPHKGLFLRSIIEGSVEFSDTFPGSLITETMLIQGINDAPGTIADTARAIRDMGPRIAFLSVPIRPPAEAWASTPEEEMIVSAVREFSSFGLRTVPLTERELGTFTYTGDLSSDLLAITSVHPMREDSVLDLVERSGEGYGVVQKLLSSGEITVIEHHGTRFYRRIPYTS